jgi:hypothetical protein
MHKNTKRIDPRYFLAETTYRDKEILEEDLLGLALNAIGFIPGFGEAADLAQAYRLFKKGDYLSAALSIVSLVPEIGDITGKGGKVLVWLNQNMPKTAEAFKNAAPVVKTLATALKTHEAKLKPLFMKLKDNEKVKEFITPDQIDAAWNALSEFVGMMMAADEPSPGEGEIVDVTSTPVSERKQISKAQLQKAINEAIQKSKKVI